MKNYTVRFFFLCTGVFFGSCVYLVGTGDKKQYVLLPEPIDVVIPCTDKDRGTLDLCIRAIRTHGQNINRVIVVSEKRQTDDAEWFDEALYPFTKMDVARCIFKNEEAAQNFAHNKRRVGWIYQQLLKLYAPFVIPHISSNVLILDADTIFIRSVEFMDEDGNGFLTDGANFFYEPYFIHMHKVLPWLRQVHKEISGITHHMLFQRSILADLLKQIEDQHGQVAWKALCQCIDPAETHRACMSEYEIYFNFTLTMTDQVKIRNLFWGNFSGLDVFDRIDSNCHFGSVHID